MVSPQAQGQNQSQGEIRVGTSHQAKLPFNRQFVTDPPPDDEFEKQREDLRWVPDTALDLNVMMYLRAARSMAAFAGMCDGGSAEDGCIAASKDDTTLNALEVLHDSRYDQTKAIQALVKCPIPRGAQKKWNEEESRRFVKGLQKYNKNFFRIQKEMFPYKTVPELVEYYYIWKKTPGANINRPHTRRRRNGSRQSRSRGTGGRNAAKTGIIKEELGADVSGSGSEDENSYDSDSKDMNATSCQHCFTTSSKNWLQVSSGPKEGAVLCCDCHANYEESAEGGTDDADSAAPPESICPDSPSRMTTRNKSKETPSKDRTKWKKNGGAVTPTTPETDSEKKRPDSNEKTVAPTSNACKRVFAEDEERENRSTECKKSKNSEESSNGESDPLLEVKPESPLAQPLPEFSENDSTNEKVNSVDKSEHESRVGEATPFIQPNIQNADSQPPKLSSHFEMDAGDSPLNQLKNITSFLDPTGYKNQDVILAPNRLTENSNPESSDTLDESARSLNFFGAEHDPSPPILTVEENYIPKDEMPTLQLSSHPHELEREPVPPMQTPMDIPVEAIKIEPGLQSSGEENSSSEVDVQRGNAGPAEYVGVNGAVPNAERQHSFEEEDGEKSSPASHQPILVPPYPLPFNEDSNEKDALVSQAAATAYLQSQHESLAQYYHQYHQATNLSKMSGPYVASGLQMEPQDLKIKQEVIAPDSSPPSIDPLQSLKEVKVPGYSNSPISQPLLPTTSSSSSYLSPLLSQSEDIKKESDAFQAGNKSASSNFLDTQQPESAQPYHLPASIPSSVSPMLNVVSSIAQPLHHPMQQASPLSRLSPAAHLAHPHPFLPMHPHQSLLQQSILAAMAAQSVHPYAHHPYAPYPYGFPYAPYPIPQPIPPPRSMESQKADGTTLHSHHTMSSSMSRSLREDDEVTTQMHHHSSSHHSASMQHNNEKQTISHSSSSSASIQQKVKRSGSPQQSSNSCHVSATLSQSQSSSISTSHGHNHSHMHQHTHLHQNSSGDALSPLLNMSVSSGSSNSRSGSASNGSNINKSSNLSPAMPSHHSILSLTGPSSASLEALRAHAAGIHSPIQMHQSGMNHLSPYMSPDVAMNMMGNEMIKVESSLPSCDSGHLGEDDGMSSPLHIPKGPSPEPKIEDSECHRSQNAIFLKHWNRGDFNSCARTDLTFKAVPESKLARKREERIRKQSEKEREERDKSHSRKTPEKPESIKPPSRGPIETITSPYAGFARNASYADMALRQFSEYRPHTGFSPAALQRSATSLGLPPQCIDPMFAYQLNMYGATSRDRLEMEHMEREKRERELRDLRDKEMHERFKEELMKSAGARMPSQIVDPHWLELQRRLAPLGVHSAPPLHPFSYYPTAVLDRERLERLGIPPGGVLANGSNPGPVASPTVVPPNNPHALDAAERMALSADPMLRLQMAGVSPEYHAHSHAHTHAHSHTHLHLHPGQQTQAPQQPAPADSPAFPGSVPGYPRPSILSSREAPPNPLALHHQVDFLQRPLADQIALQQVVAQEHFTRQMLLDREQRYSHPSLMAQHEEYFRQQRDREIMKMRALDDVSRGSR